VWRELKKTPTWFHFQWREFFFLSFFPRRRRPGLFRFMMQIVKALPCLARSRPDSLLKGRRQRGDFSNHGREDPGKARHNRPKSVIERFHHFG
jgi:hypothetical protein